MKFPVHATEMRAQHDRLKTCPFIAPIVAHTCKRVLLSYYGGYTRMIWRLLADYCKAWLLTTYWRSVMWVCDRAGWTKVVEFTRHGRRCNDPCCMESAATDCIQASVPAWFRWLTRI